MTKKALLYARVSTRNQEDNTSLQNQINTTRAYANKRNYQVVGEAKEIISGAFVLARTEFNRFLQMIADGAANVIIVDVPDRLGRGEAIANCELLVKMNGGTIEYTNRQYDLNTEEGIVMDGADKMISGLERLKTRRRSMKGKRATVEAGQVIASPFRPFGYEFDRIYDKRLRKNTYCNLAIVEDEAEIVRQMFDWFVFEGLSTHGIAKRLTKMKIPTVTDKGDGAGRNKKTGYGIWNPDTVHGILTNSSYKGEWRYKKNKVRRLDGIGGTRTTQIPYEESKQLMVPVPAIVSSDIWELAQQRMQKNKRRNFRKTKNKYLLRGRIRCSCGSAMSGYTQANGSRNQYYRCIAKYRHGKITKRPCDARNLRAADLEAGLWQLISGLLTDEDLLFKKIEAQREEAEHATKLIRQNIAAHQTRNDKDQAAISRFLDLYGDGDLSKEEYLQKRQQKERDIDRRQAEISKYQQHLRDASPLPPDREAELRILRRKLSRRIGAATLEQKQKLYELLQVECLFHDESGQVVVAGVFGSKSLHIDMITPGSNDQSLIKANGTRRNGATEEEKELNNTVGNTCMLPESSTNSIS